MNAPEDERLPLMNFQIWRLLSLWDWHKGEMANAAEWAKSLALWRFHGQDPGGAEDRCVRARSAALECAGQCLAAIRGKLQRVDLMDLGPERCYASPLGPDYYRLVPEPLLTGVPDAVRVYGSGYLARHPELFYWLEHLA